MTENKLKTKDLLYISDTDDKCPFCDSEVVSDDKNSALLCTGNENHFASQWDMVWHDMSDDNLNPSKDNLLLDRM